MYRTTLSVVAEEELVFFGTAFRHPLVANNVIEGSCVDVAPAWVSFLPSCFVVRYQLEVTMADLARVVAF